VSHVAIAAALALSDVSAGERMVAFSLASFANREHRAWPGTRVGSARAGLSRSQYLAARDALARRGLVVVEHAGDGRGNSPVVAVTFAQAGPWFDGEVNARLFEAALSWSRARGSARLLLAALAALADEQLAVSLLSTEELRAPREWPTARTAERGRRCWRAARSRSRPPAAVAQRRTDGCFATRARATPSRCGRRADGSRRAGRRGRCPPPSPSRTRPVAASRRSRRRRS
jgi:hypothetical protein